MAIFVPFRRTRFSGDTIPNFVRLAGVKTSEKHALRDVQGGQYSANIVPNGTQAGVLIGPTSLRARTMLRFCAGNGGPYFSCKTRYFCTLARRKRSAKQASALTSSVQKGGTGKLSGWKKIDQRVEQSLGVYLFVQFLERFILCVMSVCELFVHFGDRFILLVV